MPDDALFTAADDDALSTPAQVEAHARRLLASDKAGPRLASFHAQWLRTQELSRVQKDGKEYPWFDAAMKTSMATETEMFVRYVLGSEGDGRLETLLRAPFTFVDAKLAAHYDLPVPAAGFVRTNVDPKTRGGLLLQGAFLSTHAATDGSNPVKRGKVVWERVACATIPPPPNEIPMVDPPSPTQTTRERFERHSSDPMCRSCHKLLDPVGFAFENYNGIGWYRTTENQQAVDASGTVRLPIAGEIAFNGPGDFLDQLVVSQDVRECAVKQWLRFGLGRAEVAAEDAALEALYERFAASKYDVRELIVAIATSRSFLYRARSQGEMP